MSLGVQYRQGLACPCLVCAGCGVLITRVEMAGAAWSPDACVAEECIAPVVILCKQTCLGRAPWQHWPWEELGVYLVWLIQNTGADRPEKLRKLIANADRVVEMGV